MTTTITVIIIVVIVMIVLRQRQECVIVEVDTSFSGAGQIEMVQFGIVIKDGWLDVVIVVTLHVIHGGVGTGIHPLTDHLMDRGTRLPVSAVTIVEFENEEERRAGDKHPYRVRV
jgi:hypothetical protein